jgi:hypothetical protein
VAVPPTDGFSVLRSKAASRVVLSVHLHVDTSDPANVTKLLQVNAVAKFVTLSAPRSVALSNVKTRDVPLFERATPLRTGTAGGLRKLDTRMDALAGE